MCRLDGAEKITVFDRSNLNETDTRYFFAKVFLECLFYIFASDEY